MKDLSLRAVPLVMALPAPAPELQGALVRVAGDSRPYWCTGVAWEALAMSSADPRLTTVLLEQDVSNTTTTLANVFGLSASLAAYETYAVSAQVLFQSAATNNGIRLTQTVPTGATVAAQWNTPTSLTATTNANQRGNDAGAATSGVDVINTSTLALGHLVVVMGATPGLVQIRFASRNAGVNVTVKAGSNLVVTQTPVVVQF